MEQALHLKDLNFGRLDARAEFLEDLRKQGTYFQDSFLVPPNLELDDLKSGAYRFVTGLKGTGKTALLRFASISAERDGQENSFLLFKEAFSESDRRQFDAWSGVTAHEGLSELKDDVDYRDGWYWVIHHHLLDVFGNPKKDFARSFDGIGRYIKFLKSMWPEERPSVIARLALFFESASVKLSADAIGAAAEVGIKFRKQAGNTDAPRGSFLDVANKLLFSVQGRADKFINIFIDEIDISYGSKKNHVRDSKLVRDLVIAVSELNNYFLENDTPIRIICGIRSEILNTVEASGKEINKLVADYELRLSWHSHGPLANHPLIRVIEQKLLASEKAIFGQSLTGDVWGRYFPKFVQGQEIGQHLLDYSWTRPRDLVRYLNIVKRQNPRAARFTPDDFGHACAEYARESWKEIVEELQAGYMPAQLQAIRRVLTGRYWHFSMQELESRIATKANRFDDVKRLFRERTIHLVLEDLYRVGVIGNVRNTAARGEKAAWRSSWACAGFDEFNPEEDIAIHRALQPLLVGAHAEMAMG
jgi:hypothetical protein